MQTSGQFGVPPSEVPPQYNPVNNDNMNNNSNTSSTATSTPGSNQALGHLLFNLSNHDQQDTASLSLSSTSLINTNPHPAHGHPIAPSVSLGKAVPCNASDAELLQESTSQPHHENHQFSNFMRAKASSSLERFARPDGASMEWTSTENSLVQQPQQYSLQGKLASGVLPPANTNAPPSAATPTTTLPATTPVQAHTPAIMPCSVLPESAPVENQASLENGEGQSQVQEAMHLHHHQQVSLGVDEAADLPASHMKSSERHGAMNADRIPIGDIDQADEGSSAGNRWPRQETLALLQIRADMDAVFRDTSVKRPLWDEVSRKLGELGYERSAKKCKEKFENVNKYYKRTKEGKVGRQDGKNYRFFSQLEALYSAHSTTTTTTLTLPIGSNMLTSITTTSTTEPIIHLQPSAEASSQLLPISALAVNAPSHPQRPSSAETHAFTHTAVAQPTSQLPGLNSSYVPPHLDGNAGTALHSSSQSTSDDDESDGDDDEDGDVAFIEHDDLAYKNSKPHPNAPHDPSHAVSPTDQSKKRKRKISTSMMAFFEGLVKRVIDKQDQMQEKFLQAMEKRETDRMIREEAWRRQEMARMSKEHELTAQERSSAAARDAALITFLQKLTGQTLDLPTLSMSTSVPIAAPPVRLAPPLHQENTLQRYEDHDVSDPGSKRWLESEVHHLIELHSNLEVKFMEAGPKGPLWEEIANGMAERGYPNRNAKRCKEKWENINKYFKRAKESSKRRPENAKTCPYFHELDALYRKASGSLNNGSQLLRIEHAQDENVVHHPSTSNREGNLDRSSSLLMQPTNVPTEHAAVSDVSNASGTDANANNPSVADANDNRSNVGDAMRNVTSASSGMLQSIGTMQLSMDAARSSNTSTTSEHTALRGGFSAELGLSIQQKSSSVDIYQHKPVNQAEFGKLDVGLGDNIRGSLTQGELQSSTLKENTHSIAPLPNSTSFMANMLQKLSRDTTSANNNPQDQ